MCSVLASAPEKMLNTGQWEELQDLVSLNTFYQYKRKAEAKGWVRRVKHSDITAPGDFERLELENPHTVVWTVTKEWMKS